MPVSAHTRAIVSEKASLQAIVSDLLADARLVGVSTRTRFFQKRWQPDFMCTFGPSIAAACYAVSSDAECLLGWLCPNEAPTKKSMKPARTDGSFVSVIVRTRPPLAPEAPYGHCARTEGRKVLLTTTADAGPSHRIFVIVGQQHCTL